MSSFDFVATALAIVFSSTTNGEFCRPMKTTVFDYEEGWGDLVHAMNDSTRNILQQPQLSCTFGGKCDITKPINDQVNAGCLSQIKQTHLWTCQYCVAENSKLLQESEFIFFRQLFQMVPSGCIIIFTETSPHVWPDFYDLCNEYCTDMKITFVKKGRQMLMRKSSYNEGNSGDEIIEDSEDMKLLKSFREIRRYRDRKLNSGFSRQERKVTNFDYLNSTNE